VRVEKDARQLSLQPHEHRQNSSGFRQLVALRILQPVVITIRQPICAQADTPSPVVQEGEDSMDLGLDCPLLDWSRTNLDKQAFNFSNMEAVIRADPVV
jgi:hypothetical protein